MIACLVEDDEDGLVKDVSGTGILNFLVNVRKLDIDISLGDSPQHLLKGQDSDTIDDPGTDVQLHGGLLLTFLSNL